MAKREYLRFYHKDWAASGDVQDMTMEEVGVYWTLLVRQMVDGYVTSDRNKLRRVLNVDTVEEVDRLLVDKVLSKFTPFEGDPSKLCNRKLSEVIDETDTAIQRGSDNASKRWNGPAPVTAPPILNADGGRVFNFASILADYPRKKHNKAGWNKGIQMMQNYITSDEDFQRLASAVKNYAKKKAGEEERFIKNLDNFLREWTDWVPTHFQAPEAKEESAEQLNTVGKAEVKKPRTGKPPWEPGYDDPPALTAKITAWWNEERRQRWLAGEETA